MRETGPARRQDHRRTSHRGGWKPSRGLLAAVSSIALLSGAITGAVAFEATSESGQATYTVAWPTVAEEYTTPAVSAQPAAETPALTTAPTVTASAAATTPPTPTAPPALTAPPTPTLVPATSTTPTIGDAWSATPAVSTPVPDTSLSPAAEFGAQIEADWGIDVVIEGQDWGVDKASQLRNLGALAGALESLPTEVVTAATHNSHGTLSVLSNDAGRTLAGWQPYGDRAANFYASEDRAGGVRSEASQIVLQTGADRMTIAHELLHVYQMRNVPSGSYGRALLTDEMRSFMAATGWVQTVSDERLESRAHASWDEIEAMFRYDGRDLTYVSETGEAVEPFAPNPIEAFAAVGALFYAAPDGTELPDWPEYQSWLESNLG